MAYKYILNGVDLRTIGVIVSNGNDDFMKFPELKEPYKYDWPERTGVEVDLGKPVFKEKDITLRLAIIAKNESEFWNNYNAFLNLLKSPGTIRLYVGELKRSFFLYYQKMVSFERLTKLDGANKIACRYDVLFKEPVPSLLKPYAFLTMQGGGYLLTNSGQLINLNP